MRAVLIGMVLGLLVVALSGATDMPSGPSDAYIIGSVIDKTLVYCDVCGRNMKGRDGMLWVGYQQVFVWEKKSGEEAKKNFLEVYPEITKDRYEVCFVCWLKALGIRFGPYDFSTTIEKKEGTK